MTQNMTSKNAGAEHKKFMSRQIVCSYRDKQFVQI